MRSRAWNGQAAFTLLELLTTVVVVAIVAAIAVPSYRMIIQSGRLTTQIYDFAAALNLARSEAVKRGFAVTVCPSTDLATCTGSTNWEQGWIVFVDVNSNQTVDTSDAREVVLRASGALVSGYTLRATSATTLPGYVTVNPKGIPSKTGVFILCENGALNPSRAILVSITGHIAIAGDDNGVPIDASGADMTSCTP
jgi:type IV fimbrial biogenesis protein FimT